MILHTLSVGYKRPIVEAIEGTLNPGDFVCLTGRNGSGKSTLLKTLAGLLPPLQGSIGLDDKRLSDFTPSELARRVGLVVTRVPDLPNTTLRELVAYGRLPYASWFGKFSASDYEAADRAIATLGISHLASRHVSELSDGERQKAMIARALAQGTDYLLLDEPSAFLDYESKQELMQMLKNLATEQKKAILLSSHDQDLVLRYADIIWNITDGKLTLKDVK
ncbi:MAG: ABC transporter ATP-binding protein [Bacteroidales bacterium]|nr:ABC transporter ATP-binding protein [Bacteroidales bacterium]